MYLYFDKNGVLKEIINDKALRQTNTRNKIYIYIEDLTTIQSITAKYLLPSGLTTPLFEPTIEFLSLQIPYNPKQDLKFFEYYKTYNFIEIPTTFTIANVQYNVLSEAGNVALTVRVDGTALGLIVFNVEESVDGDLEIQSDEYISLAQFYYLMDKIHDVAEGPIINLIGDSTSGTFTEDDLETLQNPLCRIMLKNTHYQTWDGYEHDFLFMYGGKLSDSSIYYSQVYPLIAKKGTTYCSIYRKAQILVINLNSGNWSIRQEYPSAKIDFYNTEQNLNKFTQIIEVESDTSFSDIYDMVKDYGNHAILYYNNQYFYLTIENTYDNYYRFAAISLSNLNESYVATITDTSFDDLLIRSQLFNISKKRVADIPCLDYVRVVSTTPLINLLINKPGNNINYLNSLNVSGIAIGEDDLEGVFIYSLHSINYYSNPSSAQGDFKIINLSTGIVYEGSNVIFSQVDFGRLNWYTIKTYCDLTTEQIITATKSIVVEPDENGLEITWSNDDEGYAIKFTPNERAEHSYYLDVESSAPNSDRYLSLPDKSGILSVKDDIPNIYSARADLYDIAVIQAMIDEGGEGENWNVVNAMGIDIKQKVLNGDYDDINLINVDLNTNNEETFYYSHTGGTSRTVYLAYMLTESNRSVETLVIADIKDLKLKIGDIIYLTETQINANKYISYIKSTRQRVTFYATPIVQVPDVGEGVLTLQINGVEKGTFGANQTSNTILNITASDLGITGGINYLGVTSTTLTNGATTNPITIGGNSVTVSQNDMVIYNGVQYLFNGTSWASITVDLSNYVTKSNSTLPVFSVSSSTSLSTLYVSVYSAKPFILFVTDTDKYYLGNLVQAAVGTTFTFDFIPIGESGVLGHYYGTSISSGTTLSSLFVSQYFVAIDTSNFATTSDLASKISRNNDVLPAFDIDVNSVTTINSLYGLTGSLSRPFVIKVSNSVDNGYFLGIVEWKGTAFDFKFTPFDKFKDTYSYQGQGVSSDVVLATIFNGTNSIYYYRNNPQTFLINQDFVTTGTNYSLSNLIQNNNCDYIKNGDFLIFTNGVIAQVTNLQSNYTYCNVTNPQEIFTPSFVLDQTVQSAYSNWSKIEKGWDVIANVTVGSTTIALKFKKSFETSTYIFYQASYVNHNYTLRFTISNYNWSIIDTELQAKLDSTNIKTINGNSLIGSGDISTSIYQIQQLISTNTIADLYVLIPSDVELVLARYGDDQLLIRCTNSYSNWYETTIFNLDKGDSFYGVVEDSTTLSAFMSKNAPFPYLTTKGQLYNHAISIHYSGSKGLTFNLVNTKKASYTLSDLTGSGSSMPGFDTAIVNLRTNQYSDTSGGAPRTYDQQNAQIGLYQSGDSQGQFLNIVLLIYDSTNGTFSSVSLSGRNAESLSDNVTLIQ